MSTYFLFFSSFFCFLLTVNVQEILSCTLRSCFVKVDVVQQIWLHAFNTKRSKLAKILNKGKILASVCKVQQLHVSLFVLTYPITADQ